MKNTEIFGRRAILILYIAGFAGMLCILAALHATRDFSGVQRVFRDSTNISSEWTLDREGTRKVDYTKLGEYIDEETGLLSLYYTLPVMDNDKNIIYRSKDVYTRIKAGSDVLYETKVPQSRFYNHSPGNLWNVAEIPAKYSGVQIELEISMVYDASAVTVDTIMWGTATDIVLGLFRGKLGGILVSIIMIIIGIVMLVVDLMPAFSRTRPNHSMLWLGLYSALIGVWSMIETNILQLVVADMRILQLVNNMIMITNSMPLLLYMDCEHKIFKYRIMRIIGYANAIFILTAVFVQLSGITDMHVVLPGAILSMLVICVTLLIWVVIRFTRMIKKHEPVFFSALQLLGLCAVMLSALAEFGRYTQSDHPDRAEYIRVGMFVFIVCFAISSQIETYRILEHGLKYDIISRLAYSDGLTGLGNRTAYIEQLDEYADKGSAEERLGIVFLDVNNLKIVNDSLGHDKGDELITAASRIILDSFGKHGSVYRIGGDEFCVLMPCMSPQKEYEEGLLEFQRLIEQANKESEYSYPVQIANGFCICEALNREEIDKAVMKADSAMYENKSMLKRKS